MTRTRSAPGPAGRCPATWRSTQTLLGGDSLSEGHISTLTDTILLLRYAPEPGRIRRALTVLEMRGSAHDHAVREYVITDHGMVIGEPYDAKLGL